ncbi:cupin [Phormidium sp. LEGE 05292]|uniref:cupin domain-containing protein n=1 Tax=[Phormidium] sp. LEGE 05292 TaxID=767427 RepID=UPI00187F538C|nr:cupin domain-containing protein [Phormidium sp. LEGE 05292]MBE9228860.1 cupin [Phormidium sp. LEGE 05292]
MNATDWLLNDDGTCQICKPVREWELLREEYRFYRFLTEVEDAVIQASDDTSLLPDIRRLVRQLVLNSYWVQTQYLEASPQTGVSVLILYDEIGFPLTVQTVTFAPGTVSTIHNHGTWGVVAVLKGREKNTFWRRTNSSDFPDRIERVGEKILEPGDIISFTPNAIHSVEAIGDEPTITFNIYGETNSKNRFEYDLETATAKKF